MGEKSQHGFEKNHVAKYFFVKFHLLCVTKYF